MRCIAQSFRAQTWHVWLCLRAQSMPTAFAIKAVGHGVSNRLTRAGCWGSGRLPGPADSTVITTAHSSHLCKETVLPPEVPWAGPREYLAGVSPAADPIPRIERLSRAPVRGGPHRDRAQHCRPTAHLPGTDPTERSAATFPPPAATEWRNADTLFRTDEHASDTPGRAAAQARAPADGGRHHGAGRHRSSRLPDHDDVAGQRGGGRAGPGRRQLPGESPAGIAGEGVLHALAVRGLRVPVGRRHEPEGVSVPVGGAVMGLPAEGSRYVLPGRTDSTQGHLPRTPTREQPPLSTGPGSGTAPVRTVRATT